MPQKTELNDENRAKALKKAAEHIMKADNILILTHKSPDGDTLGSAFALCRALLKKGKKARVICADPFPKKYAYLMDGIAQEEFKPILVVAVDIASVELMGKELAEYAESVNICIDHHPSNEGYAEFTLVDPKAAATCEVIKEFVDILGVNIDKNIANCIYTGLATDSGCFRYSNTTPKTLRTAAEMVEKGADSAKLNKLLFETVSPKRMELERMVLDTLEYHLGGKAAVITLAKGMTEKAGVDESETEGLPSIPARIEGVVAGITIKEKEDNVFKISLRTGAEINASDICANFGGGGHAAAAGCRIEGTLDEVKQKLISAVRTELEKRGCAVCEQ